MEEGFPPWSLAGQAGFQDSVLPVGGFLRLDQARKDFGLPVQDIGFKRLELTFGGFQIGDGQ